MQWSNVSLIRFKVSSFFYKGLVSEVQKLFTKCQSYISTGGVIVRLGI